MCSIGDIGDRNRGIHLMMTWLAIRGRDGRGKDMSQYISGECIDGLDSYVSKGHTNDISQPQQHQQRW